MRLCSKTLNATETADRGPEKFEATRKTSAAYPTEAELTPCSRELGASRESLI